MVSRGLNMDVYGEIPEEQSQHLSSVAVASTGIANYLQIAEHAQKPPAQNILVTRAYMPSARHFWQNCDPTEKEAKEAKEAKETKKAERQVKSVQLQEIRAKALAGVAASMEVSVAVGGRPPASVHVTAKNTGAPEHPQGPQVAEGHQSKEGPRSSVSQEMLCDKTSEEEVKQTKDVALDDPAPEAPNVEASVVEPPAIEAPPEIQPTPTLKRKGGWPKGKAKAKGKASAKSKAKAVGKAGSDADQDAVVAEAEENVLDDAAAEADAEDVEDNGPAKKKGKRAAPGTQGTFAGRRPPKDPVKLAIFNEIKEAYLTTRSQVCGSNESGLKGKKESTPGQEKYWTFMHAKMSELSKEGITGGERMRQAAAAWKVKKEEVAKATMKELAEKLKTGAV